MLKKTITASKIDENRGKFKKGKKKTGGRKKGTPNKRTLDFACELDKMGFNAVEKAVNLYETTDDDGVKANILNNFFKYLYPQRKAVDMDIGSKTDAAPIEVHFI